MNMDFENFGPVGDYLGQADMARVDKIPEISEASSENINMNRALFYTMVLVALGVNGCSWNKCVRSDDRSWYYTTAECRVGDWPLKESANKSYYTPHSVEEEVSVEPEEGFSTPLEDLNGICDGDSGSLAFDKCLARLVLSEDATDSQKDVAIMTINDQGILGALYGHCKKNENFHPFLSAVISNMKNPKLLSRIMNFEWKKGSDGGMYNIDDSAFLNVKIMAYVMANPYFKSDNDYIRKVIDAFGANTSGKNVFAYSAASRVEDEDFAKELFVSVGCNNTCSYRRALVSTISDVSFLKKHFKSVRISIVRGRKALKRAKTADKKVEFKNDLEAYKLLKSVLDGRIKELKSKK